MLELDSDQFPDDAQSGLQTRECSECGREGYHHSTTVGTPPRRCRECYRDLLSRDLDPDRDDGSRQRRIRALREIDSRGFLPMRDPVDGDLIVGVEIDSGPPGTNPYVKNLRKIVERDCPMCTHDRADYVTWHAYTVEHGMYVECRACGHEIEREDTL